MQDLEGTLATSHEKSMMVMFKRFPDFDENFKVDVPQCVCMRVALDTDRGPFTSTG